MNKTIAFFALFLIAAAPRLTGIQVHSLWFDEVSTANIVSQSTIPEIIKAIFAIEGTPPLFYFLQKAFVAVTHLPLSEFSLRFLPALYGIFSCIMLFLIVQAIRDRKTALLAFLLIVVSSFDINISQEARSYSLLSLGVLVSLYVTVRWWQKPTIGWSVALATSIIAMTQIHYYAFPLAAAMNMTAFIVMRFRRLFWRYFMIVTSSSILSFSILVPLFFSQMAQITTPEKSYLTAKWIPGILYSPIKVLLGAYLFKIKSIGDISFAGLAGIIPVICILLITLYLIVRHFRTNQLSEQGKFVILTLVLAYCFHIAVGWKIPAVHPRYMAHILIPLFGIIMIATAYNRRFQLLIFITLIGFNIAGNANYFNKTKSYIEPWREVGQTIDSYITGHHENGSVIIVPHTAVGHPVAFYSSLRQVPVYVVNIDGSSTPFVHLTLFGHSYFTPLEFYTYHAIGGETSFQKLATSFKHGIFVHMNSSSKELIRQLQNEFNGVIAFTVLKIFKTNQGEISILKWQCAETEKDTPKAYKPRPQIAGITS